MVQNVQVTEPPDSVLMPPQSPAWGVPFPVAPPIELSLIDVNVIGEPLVPTADSVPETSMVAPLMHPFPLDLTIAPAWTVIVTPVGTWTQPLTISHGSAEAASVDDVVTVPLMTTPAPEGAVLPVRLSKLR